MKYFWLSFFLTTNCLATIWQEMASPVTTKARNPFLISSTLTLIAAIMEDSISDPAQRDTAEDRPCGDIQNMVI